MTVSLRGSGERLRWYLVLVVMINLLLYTAFSRIVFIIAAYFGDFVTSQVFTKNI